MYKILVSFIMVSFLIPTFAKASCTNFIGAYMQEYREEEHLCKYNHFRPAGDYTRSYRFMDIAVDANNLSIQYRYKLGPYGIVNYIADGNVHVGDSDYTGDTYSVSCDENQMHIVRHNNRETLHMIFTKNSEGEISLANHYEDGSGFDSSCHFVSRPY